jgi:hypothetical protein
VAVNWLCPDLARDWGVHGAPTIDQEPDYPKEMMMKLGDVIAALVVVALCVLMVVMLVPIDVVGDVCKQTGGQVVNNSAGTPGCKSSGEAK